MACAIAKGCKGFGIGTILLAAVLVFFPVICRDALAADLAILERVPERVVDETLQGNFALPRLYAIPGQSPGTLAQETAAERRKLLSHMVALGYLDASISASGSGTADDPLRLHPRPGPRYTIGTVRYEGLPSPVPPSVQAVVDAKVTRRTGMIAFEEIIADLGSGVVFALKEESFATARVSSVTLARNLANAVTDITVTVDPGPAMRFGTVTFRGSFRMDAAETAALVPFRTGDAYSRTAVESLRTALDRTGGFRRIRIDEAPAQDRPDVMNLSVRLWDKAEVRPEQIRSYWLIPTILVLLCIEAVCAASPSFGQSLRRLSFLPVAMMLVGSVIEVGNRLQGFLAQ